MNKTEILAVVSQIKSQWKRDRSLEDDLSLLVFKHREVFEDLMPPRMWRAVAEQALGLLTPYHLERGDLDPLPIRRQMWRSRDLHKRMCGS